MRARIGILLVAVLVGLVGCSRVRVATDYEPTTSFAALRQWAWASRPVPSEDDKGIDDPLRNARIEKAVAEVLEGKGYPSVDGAQADFLVTYHVVTDKAFDVQEFPTFGYWGYWGGFYGSRTYVDTYRERTLLIDVLDADGEALLWRGSAVERARDYSSPQAREKNIRAAVEAILKRFPPQP